MNNFTFNDIHFLQIYGTAMGTRMAHPQANLFLAKFETDALLLAPFQPYIWWRFIDDIFIVWTHSLYDLQTYTTYLNNNHSTIKFTSNYSSTSIPSAAYQGSNNWGDRGKWLKRLVREFKMQREHLESSSFSKQNNNFAPASHFLVHFFAVFLLCGLPREIS